MFNPVFLYAGAGALLVGVITGWSVRDWKADADALKASEAAAKAQDAAVAAVSKSSTLFQDLAAGMRPLETKTRNTIREVYRNVEVPADCAVPDAGVRLLDAARLNANAAATGKPIAGVRNAAGGAATAD